MPRFDHFTEFERSQLIDRARRIAEATRTGESSDLHSALIIDVGQERCVIPLAALTNVYRGVQIVPVPCTPVFVAGVASIRGHILPVLDLTELLQVGQTGTAGNSALLVVANEQLHMALQVSNIGDVRTYDPDRVKPIPSDTRIPRAEYFMGLLTDGMPLLDMNAIMSDPTIIVDDGE